MSFPRHKKTRRTVIFLAVAAAIFSEAVLLDLFLVKHTDAAPGPIVTASLNTLAAANNMQVLGADQFAVLTQTPKDAPSGAPSVNYQITVDGNAYSIPAQNGSTLSIIEGGSTGTILVGGIGVSTYEKGKATQSVADAVKQGGTANVIIRFAGLAQQFYVRGQSAASIASKRTGFNNKKASIQRTLSLQGRLKKDLPIINSVSATLDQASLSALEKNPSVQEIDPDPVFKVTQNDPAMDQIGASQVWGYPDAAGNTLTGVGERIAIIDTGVDFTHPDLGGCFGPSCKVIGGYDFVNGTGIPMDDNGHGTYVASLAAGRGVLSGVAPDAKILAYKVCDATGLCPASDIIAGINVATDPNGDGDTSDHVNVANLSLGGSGNPDDAVSLAVDNSVAAGVVYVVAAGNTGPTSRTINSPGTSRMAITVGAACETAQIGTMAYCGQPIATFTSRGPLIWNGVDLQKPDVAAPGVLICGARSGSDFPTSPTCLDAQHAELSGTSAATPLVAGSAALILQAHPSYTPAQVKALIKNTAVNLGQGMTAYDEGAGEINVAAALPSTSAITSTPTALAVASDPTQEFSSSSQAFTVAALSSDITALTATLNFSAPGVTVTLDKMTLNVASGTPDTLTPTVVIDNNLAAAGVYDGSIIFTSGGTTEGIIPITVTVGPTITISGASPLDYGIDNPSLPSWTSSQPIVIQNLRTDVSQAITLTPSFYPAGITFTAPASVTVPAGSSTTIVTGVSVANTSVANGNYSGTLAVNSTAGTMTYATKFTKYFVLTLQDVSGTNLAGSVVVVQSGTDRMVQVPSTNSTTIYLNNPGSYDIIVYYLASDGTYTHEYVDFKEGNVFGPSSASSTVTVSRNDANHQVITQATDQYGHAVTLQSYNSTDIYLPTGLAFVWLTTNGNVNYYSNVSKNYLHIQESQNPPVQPAPTMDFFYGSFTGLSGDITFANAPSDLKMTNVQVNTNLPTGTSVLPILSWCVESTKICAGVYSTNSSLALPFTQTMYAMTPAKSYYQQTTNTNRVGCPASGPCNSVFTSVLFDPVTGIRTPYLGATSSLFYPTMVSSTIYNGLGPLVWFGAFANTNSLITLAPYNGSLCCASPFFVRQDYSYPEYPAVPYTLYDASTSQVVATGAIATGTFINYLGPVRIGAVGGHYELRIAPVPYQIGGQSFTASVDEKFNTSLADPNPPALRRLAYFTNGAQSEVHDSATSSIDVLKLNIDPVGGVASSVTVSYSQDGVNFTPLSVTQASGTYNAIVPGISTSTLTLSLTAKDDSGNQLSYTFQLPAINPVLRDITPPVTTITAPLTGQVVGSTTIVQVSSTDNIGVVRTELYLDGKLFTSSTLPGPSYSFTWKTASSTAGPHTLQSKAYDAASNVGSSTIISVTVDNTAPKVSLTAPASGATVSGSVIVAATSSDANGVARVEFYLDTTSTLVGVDTTTPFSILWDSTKTAVGSHKLFAIAYDVAGNTTNSATVKVTVQAPKDTTPPVTSITSPTNGSTVARNSTVTITATATDNVSVTRVKFLVNGSQKCSDSSSPYICSWSVPRAASTTYKLQSQATDAAGNTGTSAIVSVTAQ